ncbi:MAG: helix-turn-helix transcriptional regulator [Pseudohongiellaceae bacterium]
MTQFINLASALAISQLVFLSCSLFVHFKKHRAAQLFAVFCVCLIAYLITATTFIPENPVITFVLFRLAVATPAVLWLFAVLLFVDEKKIPPVAICAMALYMLARAGGGILYAMEYQFTALSYTVGFVLPQIIMLGFAVHAVYLGIIGRDDDLVEERRRVRIPFVIAMGVLIATVIGNGFLAVSLSTIAITSTISFLDFLNAFLASYAFAVALALNLAVFAVHRDAAAILTEPLHLNLYKKILVIKRPDATLLEKLKIAMEQDQLYHRMGLTIGDLAQAMSVPDHRLRNLINKEMHFRNFNQFLNSYRIREAGCLLQSSDESIANIALDVGYASLSSFNKAFKDIHRRPPREYRLIAKVKRGEAELLPHGMARSLV